MRLASRRVPTLAAVLAAALLAAVSGPAASAQDENPVLPPADLAVGVVQSNSITITWTDTSGGLSAFEIQRQEEGAEFLDVATAPPGVTQWTDTAVVPGGTYLYRVRAVLDGLTSDYTDVVLATSPDVAPADLRMTGLASRSVDLLWSEARDGVASFDLQRAPVGGEFADLATVPGDARSYEDLAVAPASNYQYRIRALLDGVPTEWSAPATGITSPTPPPSVPGKPVLEVLSPSSILVQWADLGDEEVAFEVFRGVDGAAPSLAASLPAGSTSWTDGACEADRTYAYRVRAVTAEGPSAPSATTSVATPATLSPAMAAGRRVDSPRFARDTLDVSISLDLPSDPRTAGIAIGIGAAGEGTLLSLPANGAGWTERKGILTWKSPRKSVVKSTLTVDAARGTVRLKATGLELGAVTPSAVRLWVRTGEDAGSVTAPWTAKKAGTLVY